MRTDHWDRCCLSRKSASVRSGNRHPKLIGPDCAVIPSLPHTRDRQNQTPMLPKRLLDCLHCAIQNKNNNETLSNCALLSKRTLFWLRYGTLMTIPGPLGCPKPFNLTSLLQHCVPCLSGTCSIQLFFAIRRHDTCFSSPG